MAPVVYLASSSPHLVNRVRAFIGKLPVRLETGGPDDVVRAVSARSARVLITDSVEAAWEVRSQVPACRVILLAVEPDLLKLRAALRFGVHEVLVPGEVDLVGTKVLQALAYTGAETAAASLVIAIYSGSGGLGRTTLATAMGRAYARLGLRTLLIDGVLALGGVDHLLGIRPPTTMANLLPVMGELDPDQLTSATVQIQSNLDVLCAPGDSAILPQFAPEHVERLLSVARRAYQVTIVDMPSAPGALELAFLRQADQIPYLLTASPEALRTLSYVLIALQVDRVERSKIGIVHRLRLPAALELDGANLAKQVGLPFLGTLPHDWSRTLRTEKPGARAQEGLSGLDTAAHRLAVRIAARSGIRFQAGEPATRPRPALPGLSWLKGGFSFGWRR